jgi:hypothetical protein
MCIQEQITPDSITQLGKMVIIVINTYTISCMHAEFAIWLKYLEIT